MLKHKPSRVICEVGYADSLHIWASCPYPFGFTREAPEGVRGAPCPPPAECAHEGIAPMTLVTSIPIFDGRAWYSTPLNPTEAEAATWAERNGFVVADEVTRRLVGLWFSWCELRNRPAIIV